MLGKRWAVAPRGWQLFPLPAEEGGSCCAHFHISPTSHYPPFLCTWEGPCTHADPMLLEPAVTCRVSFSLA